jgi:hypothetical protein
MTAVAMLLCGYLVQESNGQDLTRESPGLEERAFSFEMRGKPWGAVFEWLTDKTGLPFISKDIPTGSFNFIARKGQKYTMPKVIDIINDGLLLQNYVLIRRATSFPVVSADQELEPSLVPWVTLEELPKRGKTEIISTMLRLDHLVAQETASEVKKQMGPFGKVVVLSAMNMLILRDSTGNLERIISTIQNYQQGVKPPLLEVIPLTTLDCVRVADTLKGIFPGAKNRSPYIDSDSARNIILVKGSAEQVAEVKAAIRSMGENPASGNSRVFTLENRNGAAVADALQRILPQMYPNVTIRRVAP